MTPAAEKIWSLSRRMRCDFCPRSAVLRYREAPAALQDQNSPFLRRIYACSKRISDGKFIREILLHTMQTQFYTAECDASLLPPAVMENFSAEFRRMICGRSRYQLFSLCSEEFDFEAKERELRQKIAVILHNISDTWYFLLQTPPESRRAIAKILDLQINDWRCMGSPLCALYSGGKLCFVEFRSGDFINALTAAAALHRFYAVNRCGRAAHEVESWVLEYQSGKLYRFSGGDTSDTLAALNTELAQWESWWNMPWDAVPGKYENCPRCVFKDVCSEK